MTAQNRVGRYRVVEGEREPVLPPKGKKRGGGAEQGGDVKPLMRKRGVGGGEQGSDASGVQSGEVGEGEREGAEPRAAQVEGGGGCGRLQQRGAAGPQSPVGQLRGHLLHQAPARSRPRPPPAGRP